MPTTPGGIFFTELTRGDGSESGRESFGREKWTATRVFHTAWSTRHAFVNEFIGGVDAFLNFTPPATYPALPQMKAVSAQVRGFGKPSDAGPGSMIEFPHAEVTVQYETPDQEDDNDENLSESISFAAQALTMPEGSFRFLAGGSIFDDDGAQIGTVTGPTNQLLIDESPGKLMPSATYSLNFKKHPSPPFNDIQFLVGKRNGNDFNPLGINFPAGTLLFDGVDTDRQLAFDPTTGAGIQVYQLAYKFLFRRIPWNLVFNPKPERGAAGWAEVEDKEGNPLFLQGDFDILIF